MTDLPNLQDIKAEYSDYLEAAYKGDATWADSCEHELMIAFPALVDALEAVIAFCSDPINYTGWGDDTVETEEILDLINQHLTIGETK